METQYICIFIEKSLSSIHTVFVYQAFFIIQPDVNTCMKKFIASLKCLFMWILYQHVLVLCMYSITVILHLIMPLPIVEVIAVLQFVLVLVHLSHSQSMCRSYLPKVLLQDLSKSSCQHLSNLAQTYCSSVKIVAPD